MSHMKLTPVLCTCEFNPVLSSKALAFVQKEPIPVVCLLSSHDDSIYRCGFQAGVTDPIAPLNEMSGESVLTNMSWANFIRGRYDLFITSYHFDTFHLSTHLSGGMADMLSYSNLALIFINSKHNTINVTGYKTESYKILWVVEPFGTQDRL